MKKSILLLIAGAMLAMTSCHTSGTGSTSVTPTTPTSTFNITINGHSYHLSGHPTSSRVSPYLDLSGLTIGGSVFQFTATCSDVTQGNKVIVKLGAWKTDMSSALGTYYNGYDSSSSGFTWPGGYPGNNATIQVIDVADGGKGYTNYGVYAGQKSTINVTVSNSTELKGTFNLNLSYNGSIYNITGDFDYKH